MTVINDYIRQSAILWPLLTSLARIAVIFLLSGVLLAVFRQRVFWLTDLLQIPLMWLSVPMLHSVFVGMWFGGSYEKYQYVLFPLVIGAAIWGVLAFLYHGARKACASKVLLVTHRVLQVLLCISTVLVTAINGFCMWHGMFEDQYTRPLVAVYEVYFFVWPFFIGAASLVILVAWLRKVHIRLHVEVQ